MRKISYGNACFLSKLVTTTAAKAYTDSNQICVTITLHCLSFVAKKCLSLIYKTYQFYTVFLSYTMDIIDGLDNILHLTFRIRYIFSYAFSKVSCLRVEINW